MNFDLENSLPLDEHSFDYDWFQKSAGAKNALDKLISEMSKLQPQQKTIREASSKVFELLKSGNNGDLPLQWLIKIALTEMGVDSDPKLENSVVISVEQRLLLDRISGIITL